MWLQNTLPCTKVSLNKPSWEKKELTEKFCFLYHSFDVVGSLCESFVQQCFCLFLRDWVLQADCGQQGEGLCVCPQGFVHVVCHHHGLTDAVGCQVTLDETWGSHMETLQALSQHHRHSPLYDYWHWAALSAEQLTLQWANKDCSWESESMHVNILILQVINLIFISGQPRKKNPNPKYT